MRLGLIGKIHGYSCFRGRCTAISIYAPATSNDRLQRLSNLQRVMDGQASSVVTSTLRTSSSLYCLHKSANLLGILDALGYFYAATDIHGIGTHLSDGLGNVLSSQSARQNN
jgi:hypothetical protein